MFAVVTITHIESGRTSVRTLTGIRQRLCNALITGLSEFIDEDGEVMATVKVGTETPDPRLLHSR